MPLGLAGARRVPAMAAMLRTRATRGLPRAPELARRMQVGACCRGPGAGPGGSGDGAAGADEPPTAPPGGSCRCWPAAWAGTSPSRERSPASSSTGWRWPAEKIEVVHNAVDVDRFDELSAPPGLREEIGAGRERPMVLTIGRLDEQKGYPVLLEAAARLPRRSSSSPAKALNGRGLEALAGRLGVGDRVRFLGHRTDVPQLLAAGDVFALPSLYEGTSLAVLEAMAARRPVVGTAIGGTEELIDDGESGLLVQPGDADALAAALGRLLADAGLRDSLAARGRSGWSPISPARRWRTG